MHLHIAVNSLPFVYCTLESREHRMSRSLIVAVCFSLVVLTGVTLAVAERLEDTDAVPLDHKAIQYAELRADDAVARLEKQIEKGAVKLEFQRNRWGYLPSLLKQLGVNTDSQVLVFSKTS